MAKEAATSRIPRLDAVSRIPLPGSQHLRPASTAYIAKATKLQPPTQILTTTAGGAVGATQRPTSLSVLRPSLQRTQAPLKNASPGERLSTAANLVSRKTTTALKRFFSKPEKLVRQLSPSSANCKAEEKKSGARSRIPSKQETTSRPLMRSSTFVRSDVNLDAAASEINGGILTQSTPAPSNLKGSSSTRLSTSDVPHILYTTQTLDVKLTSKLDDTGVSTLHCADSTFAVGPGNVRQVLSKATDKDCAAAYGRQDHVQSGKVVGVSCEALDFNDPNLTQMLWSGHMPMDYADADACSPMTNTTYTNPGSTENMQMLEDISVPFGFDLDVTLQSQLDASEITFTSLELVSDKTDETMHTLTLPTPPDKSSLKLALNSTMNSARLLDRSPAKQMHMLNFTKEFLDTSFQTGATATPDRHMPMPVHLLSPLLLKGAQSDLVLPTRTPDEEFRGEAMEVDTALTTMGARTKEFLAQSQQQPLQAEGMTISLQDVTKQKPRFSFGFDLTESTLDCSIELVDVSLSPTAMSQANGGGQSTQSLCSQTAQALKKQNTLDLDESLGILTPDQMKEFLDSPTTANNTKSANNLHLPLTLNSSSSNNKNNRLSLHQLRMDTTPSPEELPLDPMPVAVKSDETDDVVCGLQKLQQHKFAVPASSCQGQFQGQGVQQQCAPSEPVSLNTDTADYSKTDQMTKSNVSKISTSFITSVTSVTSLDTGYQGDGEMSRPASRGACDHSPSNGPAIRKGGHVSRQPSFNQQQAHLPPIRRQDPMTDSDFFTESDADDIYNRRAHVIDGQLYGPGATMQPTASVFISEDPHMEDSCMESSGIFTDVENRCDEDLAQMRRQDTPEEMSPDADDSTETVKSAKAGTRHTQSTAVSGATATGDLAAAATAEATALAPTATGQGQSNMSGSQTSSTIQSSLSTDRLSSVDGNSVNVDYKSFSSLEEAFVDCAAPHQVKSFSAGSGERTRNTPLSLHKVSSTRKHASLTSLCSANSSASASGGAKAKANTRNSLPLLARVRHTPGSATATAPGSGAVSETESLTGASTSDRGNKTTTNTFNGGATSANVKREQIAKSKLKTPPQPSPPLATGASNVSRKTHVPNKWDAVMNKIASNKALVKRNYNDVKSKVSTRVSACAANGNGSGETNATPRRTLAKSSKADIAAAGSGNQTPQSKRYMQSIGKVKRGRSYSKDSPKSSQSDLSVASATPKLLAKAPPLRSAKKRDVRNLSISPTDLGPPPKTQQTGNGTATTTATTTNTRSKSTAITLTQKRVPVCNPQSVTSLSSNSTSTAVSSVQTNGNINKLAKKDSIAGKSADTRQTSTEKIQTKDQSRTATPTTANTSRSGSKAETPTELHEIISNGGSATRYNNKSGNKTNAKEKADKEARTLARNSSPILEIHGKKIPPTTLTDKKPHSKLHAVSRKLLLGKQKPNQSASDVAPERSNDTAGDGCTEDRKKLQETEHQQKNVEALGVLLQYLAYDLDAFACPKVKQSLEKTLQLLDKAKSTCTELQDQLCDKEAYYTRREDELQALHRCELTKAKSNLVDFETLANGRISALESQLAERDAEHRRNFECYRLETENMCAQKERQLLAAAERECDLQARLDAAQSAQCELREKIVATESRYDERLDAAAKKEEELSQRVQMLSKELELLQQKKETNERELRDRLNLTQDEIEVLRSSQKSVSEYMERGATPRSSSGSSTELVRLQSEAESLRSVLELKQKEISKLSKHNEELMRDAGDRAAMHGKISFLESQNELMQSEMSIKAEKEKEYVRQIDELQKAYRHENFKRKRLAYDIEALQWQLKQRSEQLHIVEAKLHELSSREALNATNASIGSLGWTSTLNRTNSRQASSNAEDATPPFSPPVSPIVKGVIQKAESVSWVLEMDDDTPVTAASKLVKRAGSLRSCQRSPFTRRQLSLNASAAAATGAPATAGPNPLSQSVSAASVIGEHSSESSSEFVGRSHARIRSKSVSVKDTDMDAKFVANSELTPTPTTFKLRSTPTSSTPTPSPMQSVNCFSQTNNTSLRAHAHASDLKMDEEIGIADGSGGGDSLFRRPNSLSARKLITCDTSALNCGERLELRSLQTHPSVHDLKALKAAGQHVQESAGEAMVSGTNSEDEVCSGSSEDIVSSGCASSASSSSTTSLHNMKNSHMSLEEVMLLDKMGSLNGTPMEVSWSEDVEALAVAGNSHI